jgi:hypothetical protein
MKTKQQLECENKSMGCSKLCANVRTLRTHQDSRCSLRWALIRDNPELVKLYCTTKGYSCKE